MRFRECGLSLIELLIALVISTLLMTGVITLFVSSKQSYRIQDALARLQENGRTALALLSQDIRIAGNRGCSSRTNNHLANTLPDIGGGLNGYEYETLPAILLYNSNNNLTQSDAVINSDVILIKGSASETIRVITSTPSSTKISNVDAATIERGDIMLISDCSNAEIFSVSAVNRRNGIISHDGEGNNYSGHTTLSALKYLLYFVGIDNATTLPNLKRKRITERAGRTSITTESMVEGVERLEILYGEDISGNNTLIRFVSADAAELNMEQVNSVRIHLLAATLEDNLAPKPQPFYFKNQLITPATAGHPGDRRLRREFTTTIHLRSKRLII